MTRKDTIICDLDGTIALCEHRRHLIPDWPAFFAACVDDEPNHAVIDCLATLMRGGYTVLIFSGRSDEVLPLTRDWLNRHGVKYHRMCMRREGDYRPDEELKREMLDKFVDRDRVAFVLDDRQKVVDMWRSEGLACFQVASGDF